MFPVPRVPGWHKLVSRSLISCKSDLQYKFVKNLLFHAVLREPESLHLRGIHYVVVGKMWQPFGAYPVSTVSRAERNRRDVSKRQEEWQCRAKIRLFCRPVLERRLNQSTVLPSAAEPYWRTVISWKWPDPATPAYYEVRHRHTDLSSLGNLSSAHKHLVQRKSMGEKTRNRRS